MGRCNNKRAQQAAAQLRNTPSRARFSKPPPSLRNKNKKKNGGGGRGAGRGGSRGGGGRGGRGGQHASVIDKLSKRVESKSQTTNAKASSQGFHSLGRMDVSKLDEVTLSEESIELVTKLLTDLGIMESQEQAVDLEEASTADGSCSEKEEELTNDYSNAHYSHASQLEGTSAPAARSSAAYSEYEDDTEEMHESGPTPQSVYDLGENVQLEEEGAPDDGCKDNEDRENGDVELPNKEDDLKTKLRLSPLFLHLTSSLSFSPEQADRACFSVENQWSVPNSESNGDAKNKNAANSKKTEELLGLAMDWLCLHLTEQELNDGFKANPKMQKQNSSLSSRTIPLMGTGKTRPIPHASISLAAPLTNDQEWRDNVQVQARTVGFVRLGFQQAQAEEACRETKHTVVASNIPPALQDEEALLLLLKRLRDETVGSDTENDTEPTQVDLEFAKEEREQEMEALVAIYDDALEANKNRVVVHISPADDLKPPARNEDCKLHVFEQLGYPVLEAPLLLFSNPTLPPSLLRQINVELIRQAQPLIGEPAIFTLVDYLSSNLCEMQKDFIKKQYTMEIEAEQLRLRREAGHIVDDTEIDNDSSGGNLSRRQRAKLKATEKAYDRGEQIEKENEQKRLLQAKRIEQVQRQEKTHRYDLAEQTVRQREKERIQDEAERAARGAMNSAFLEGKTADEARAAARKARKQSLRESGEDLLSSDEDEVEDAKDAKISSSQGKAFVESNGFDVETENIERNGNIEDGAIQSSKTKVQAATPTTVAFMERLRRFYQDSAQAKRTREEVMETVSKQNGGTAESEKHSDREMVHLSEPKVRTDDNRAQSQRIAPEPVAIATGELSKVIDDVIKVQKEQPWLVSEEARAPALDYGPVEKTPETQDEAKRINTRLREELQRMRKSADDWAKKQTNLDLAMKKSPSRGGKSPQQFYKMMSQRRRLPAFEMKQEIIETIDSNQVTVISGDTGCGKTTQVPQLVLDDLIMRNAGASANIIVTQPRRISAIGVAERVASERCERVGDTAGYSIRLENKRSSKTRLLLCTTGILMRRLQCDPDLASVSHVFVDEVHERDINTDFLLIILRDLLQRRKSLKLILMSATLNADSFSAYFSGCPVVSIPGRTFPVTEHRLEHILQITGYEVKEDSDYALKVAPGKARRWSKSAMRKMYPKYSSTVIDSLSRVDESVINYELLAELLEHIVLNEKEGAILVFLPGIMEITKAIEEMYKTEVFTDPSRVVVYPLHSSLTTAEQKAVFDVPPEGVRKIVVSTNIAETSITIEDVVFVVDSGRVKENRQDEVNQMPTLVECWVSRASAKQRRGRAGRVRPGISYHMYSSHTFQEDMSEYQLPEMLRVGLEDLTLQVLLLDLGEPSGFLAKALNPPSALAMQNSLNLLQGLGAVDCEWGERKSDMGGEDTGRDAAATSCSTLNVASGLTALGFHLATLPVDPRVGKMMIYGALFGCIDPALTIAASMSARNPFLSPFDRRDEANAARQEFATQGSDHLTTLVAFQKWKDIRRSKGEKAAQAFLRESFLSRMTLFQMEDLRRQFADLLVDIGFLPRGFRLASGRKGPQQRSLETTCKIANENESNMALVKAVLCAGLYPNIIVAPRSLVRTSGVPLKGDKEAGECAFQSTKGEVYLHPCTISFSSKSLDSRYCCYHEIVKTSKTYVRDCTPVSEFALLLFGGSLKVYHRHGVVTVDDWLKFKISAKPATLVKHLRAQMEVLLLKKIVSPEEDVTGSAEGRAMIQAVSTLLEREVVAIGNRELTGADIVQPYHHLPSQHNNSGRGNNRRKGRGKSRNNQKR